MCKSPLNSVLSLVQITVWGTSDEGGSSIEDYANKQWAGLMGSFYRARCACIHFAPAVTLPQHQGVYVRGLRLHAHLS